MGTLIVISMQSRLEEEEQPLKGRNYAAIAAIASNMTSSHRQPGSDIWPPMTTETANMEEDRAMSQGDMGRATDAADGVDWEADWVLTTISAVMGCLLLLFVLGALYVCVDPCGYCKAGTKLPEQQEEQQGKDQRVAKQQVEGGKSGEDPNVQNQQGGAAKLQVQNKQGGVNVQAKPTVQQPEEEYHPDGGYEKHMDAFHKYILETVTTQEERNEAEKEAYENFQKYVENHADNPWPKDPKERPNPSPLKRLVGDAFIKMKIEDVGAKTVSAAEKANDWRQLQPLKDHYKLITGKVQGPTPATQTETFVGHIRNRYNTDGNNYYVLHGVHCENSTASPA